MSGGGGSLDGRWSHTEAPAETVIVLAPETENLRVGMAMLTLMVLGLGWDWSGLRCGSPSGFDLG